MDTATCESSVILLCSHLPNLFVTLSHHQCVTTYLSLQVHIFLLVLSHYILIESIKLYVIAMFFRQFLTKRVCKSHHQMVVNHLPQSNVGRRSRKRRARLFLFSGGVQTLSLSCATSPQPFCPFV